MPKPTYPHQATPTLLSKPKFSLAFLITYNPHNPNFREWLKEVQPLLLEDQKMKKIYPCPPSVSYRKARNLKQILVRSRLRQLPHSDCSGLENKPPGCYRHSHGGRGRSCQLCPRLKEGVHFRKKNSGLAYKILHHFTCKSKLFFLLL